MFTRASSSEAVSEGLYRGLYRGPLLEDHFQSLYQRPLSGNLYQRPLYQGPSTSGSLSGALYQGPSIRGTLPGALYQGPSIRKPPRGPLSGALYQGPSIRGPLPGALYQGGSISGPLSHQRPHHHRRYEPSAPVSWETWTTARCEPRLINLLKAQSGSGAPALRCDWSRAALFPSQWPENMNV